MSSKARLTVDMSPEEHMYLKLACAKLGVSMREFVIHSTFEKIEDIEDEWLAEKARETLDKIESGAAKTLSWNQMMKRLSK